MQLLRNEWYKPKEYAVTGRSNTPQSHLVHKSSIDIAAVGEYNKISDNGGARSQCRRVLLCRKDTKCHIRKIKESF